MRIRKKWEPYIVLAGLFIATVALVIVVSLKLGNTGTTDPTYETNLYYISTGNHICTLESYEINDSTLTYQCIDGRIGIEDMNNVSIKKHEVTYTPQ